MITAVELGKYLNDPIKGADAMGLSPHVQELIKAKVESGDMQTAQALILNSLTNES